MACYSHHDEPAHLLLYNILRKASLLIFQPLYSLLLMRVSLLYEHTLSLAHIEIYATNKSNRMFHTTLLIMHHMQNTKQVLH